MDARLKGRGALWAVLIVTAVISVFLGGQGPAQEKVPPQPAEPDGKAPVVGKNRFEEDLVGLGQMRRWLEGAKRDIANQQYIRAVAELQKVLDTDEDRTVKLEDSPDAPQKSLKFAALTLVGELVKSGQNDYETQFGEAARGMLDTALANGSSESLEAIVRRYFHTRAGYEATYRLANLRMDRGAWLDAALYYDRLREFPWAAKAYEPELTLKSAVAWHRAGYSGPALESLKSFRTSGAKTIQVAGKSVDVFQNDADGPEWMNRVFGPVRSPRGPDDWLMVGGDVRRTATSQGSTPYLNQGWHRSSIAGSCDETEQDDALERMLVSAMERDSNKPPLIPAMQPLVVGEVLIYRTLGGLRAVKAATGEPIWKSADQDYMLDLLLQTNVNSRNGVATLPMFVTGRTWRDQTYGTLSSNGTHVFAVEPSVTPTAETFRVRALLVNNMADNRLVAYDAREGSMIWEIGSPTGDVADPYSGAYFLGPPLPVGDRLYVLADFSGEVRLICLKPQTGEAEWMQSMGMPQQQQMYGWEPYRRTCGLSPSFAGGIFVCPLEEGKVVAFDRTTRTLLWQYDYDPPTEGGTLQQARLRQMQLMNRAQQERGQTGNDLDRWIDSLAVIADDRVLLTPRDLSELLCLDLRQGTVLWRAPRSDGLFLAGVHQRKVIIVGQKSVTARSLDDGKPVWSNGSVPIPTPSGRGFVSSGQLYLPLSTGAVVPIDLEKGQKGPESIAREGRVPGNLVATSKAIVSQGINSIDGFLQYEALQSEIAAALEKDPNDATAITLRGEIRLQRGETDLAYADFQRALELKPDDERAKRILIDSFLEGLRTDFQNFRGKAEALDGLISDLPTRSTFLLLLAQGAEQQGDPLGAFRAYERLMDPEFESAPPQEQGGVTLGIARLVRSRVSALLQAAAVEEQQAIADGIRKHWDAALQKSAAAGADPEQALAPLRRFLSYLDVSAGQHPALTLLAQDARTKLLDLLESGGQWLEAEIRLGGSAPAAAEPGTSLARWANVLAASSRPREALPVLERLQRDFGTTVVRADRTGGQFAAEWLAKPEMQSAKPFEWPVVRPRITTQPVNMANARTARSSVVPVEGSPGPFFQDVTFEIDGNSFRDLTARDRNWEKLWTLSLANVPQAGSYQLYRIRILDHLVLLSLGTQLVAIDTLGTAAHPGPRILWRQALSETARTSIQIVGRVAGRRRAAPVDALGNTIVGLAALTREAVYVLRPAPSGRTSVLSALDPLTGNTLWSRDVTGNGLEILADDKLVFVLPSDADAAQAYSVLDGAPAGTRAVPKGHERIAAVGHDLILWSGVPAGKLVRYDVASGREVWTQAVHPRSWLSVIEDDEILVIEPEKRFAVIQVEDGHRRIDNPDAFLAASPASDWVVQRSRDRYVLLPSVGPSIHMPQRSVSARGLNASVIVGTIYAFDRPTGRRLWDLSVEGHGMEVYQSPHLPVVLFLSMVTERKQMPNPGSVNSSLVACLDTRTGVMIHEHSGSEIAQLTDTISEPDRGQLTFRLYQSELSLDFTRPPDEPEKAGQ